MSTLRFPQDELPHHTLGEWWYLNGHLTDARHNEWAFMYCLFRVDPKRVGVPILRVVPTRSVYFPHSVITNITRQEHDARVHYLSLHTQAAAGDRLSLACTLPQRPRQPHRLEETALFTYDLQTDQLNLTLAAEKPPLLVGGTGQLTFNRRNSFYYSIPRLAARGQIQWQGQSVPVRGTAWMDHQWANVPPRDLAWTWFSLQLNNGIEILAGRYKEGSRWRDGVSISLPDGSQLHRQRFSLQPVGQPWQSPQTTAKYQLAWRLRIRAIEADLVVEPKVEQQEMLFGPLNYWEGPLRVAGSVGSKAVTGNGFLELVGRQARYGNLKFVRALLAQAL
jgi:predicted secreted hydrolase